ncbi:MAG: cytochrome c oxidase subunit 3 [Candidatus Sulfotelmatobacter sp.]
MPVDVHETEKSISIPRLGGSGHDRPPRMNANDGRLRALQDGSPPPGSTAIWVGIAAITMTFAALTSALVVRQGSGMDWQRLALPNILLLNTLILLVSSVTLELFRRDFLPATGMADPQSQVTGLWLYATLLLGMFFVAGQYIAWKQLQGEGLYLASNPSSSFFYLLTAAHALHVLGGLGGLTYILVKLRRTTLRKSTLDVATKYWHFMDVLWVYLLVLLWAKL